MTDEDEIVVKISPGQKIALIDKRVEEPNQVIAEGTIQSIGEQEGVQYLYLDTGYYIVVHPSLGLILGAK